MQKERTFLILGIWISILPYLGFPSSWKDIFYTISGIIVIYLSYLLYKDNNKKKNTTETFDSFRENSNFNENDTKIEIKDNENDKDLN